MIKFVCDNCKAENDFVKSPECFNKKEVPGHWITVDFNYYNDMESDLRKVIVTHGLHHFCSQQCLNDYLFYKYIY